MCGREDRSLAKIGENLVHWDSCVNRDLKWRYSPRFDIVVILFKSVESDGIGILYNWFLDVSDHLKRHKKSWEELK